MEFRDLKAQYVALKDKIDEAMLKVASQGNFIMGSQVAELEKQLAEYVGAKHCITCANGTDALSMVLMAWGIQEGDAVFVPDFTFFASGEVVSFEGASPVFVDVEETTFNISCEKLEQAIDRVKKEGVLTPKAIIAVDLFGLPADFDKLQKIAEKHGLLLLEDGAQGFGGKIRDKRACSFGDAATTSFFPAKPLGCYGDGGAIFLNDDHTAELIKSIRVHGKGSFKYDNIRIGMNSRLDTLQAAILQLKFEAFKDYELDAVNHAAQEYSKQLQSVVKTPLVPDGFYSSWAQYTLILKNKEQRDGLQSALKEKGIPSMVYYPKPMHKQEAFLDLSHHEQDFETTSRLCDCVISLPMHPYLKQEDIDLVCTEVKNYLLNY
ncbi:MAG: DegT/DnrJ/EryC1/StrS aminotransferase family protein [Oscillospiraceae bacterium]|nr:DegT/DnrJ/EryC1/StrS aminotransferase family protein [Oscillospiraceae bacterium]